MFVSSLFTDSIKKYIIPIYYTMSKIKKKPWHPWTVAVVTTTEHAVSRWRHDLTNKLAIQNGHYPREHCPVSDSLPPLVNAGLSLHCSTSFSRNYFHSKHSSIWCPEWKPRTVVHGRGARPSSPSKLDLISDTHHVHSEAGAWTSCCQRYQASTAATNISGVTFGIGFQTQGED